MKEYIIFSLFIGLILISGCINVAEKYGNTEMPTESMYDTSDVGVKYELKILEEVEKGYEVNILVILKDNSRIIIEGTKEQRIKLLKQRDEWFKPKINEVLLTFSEREIKNIGKRSTGFSGTITKEGFEKLINNPNIEEIIEVLDVGAHTMLDDSVPLINPETGKLRICPDNWIDNRMPCGCVNETDCGGCENRQYFIINDNRRELEEFDLDWIKEHCEITPQIVY